MADSLRYILVGAGGYGAHWCRFTLPRLKESGKAVCVAAVDTNPDAFKNAQQYLGVAPERDREQAGGDLFATRDNDVRTAFWWMSVTVFIDATDGTFARAARVT